MKNDPAVRARNIVKKHGLDAMLFSDMKNIRYLTGFTGSDALLFITADSACFMTDSRYMTQAGEQVRCELLQYKQKETAVADFVSSRFPQGRIGFESQQLSYAGYCDLQQKCGRDVSLVPVADASAIRSIKNADELSLISTAATISRKALESIVDIIRPGISEREIALQLEIACLKNGSEAKAFDFIVASGVRGAMPHGVASEKKIAAGDVVTIDFGSCHQGYFSDETVNFAVGDIPSELSRIHAIVLEAHDRAIAAIAPGMPLKEIDRVARDFIAKKGYDAFFGHGLGHGVGLDVHEWPRVSPSADGVAEPGIVFTVEPGIYKPGLGGVRIEDIVAVTENGCRLLTDLPKNLRVLPV